jgi:hypothetical protein
MLKGVRGAVAASLLAASVIAPTRNALTAVCVEKPPAPDAHRGHWYYHSDRVNHRKCWFERSRSKAPLGGPQATEAAIEQPPADKPASKLTAHQRNASPMMTQTERDALFQQYLKWEELRAGHDELFQEFLRWDKETKP